MSNIYILVFLKGFVKVGKADDILKRLENLERVWGDVDLVNSYYLSVKKENVFKVESMLHHLVAAHSADVGSGDGHTEMFHKDSLPLVMQYLDIYINSSPDDLKLVKGIKKLKPIKANKERKYKSKYEKHLEASARVIETFEFNKNVLRYLSRIIGILHKNSDKIEYRIVGDKNGYTFLIKNQKLCKAFSDNKGIVNNTINLGCTKIETYEGGFSFTCIVDGASCDGEVVAFRAKTNFDLSEPMTECVAINVESMIKSLPVKSELACKNNSGDFGEELILN